MTYHVPVMPEETAQYLVNDEKGFYVDCTLGGGGHSEYLLKKFPGIKILGLDRDEEAVKFAKERLSRFAGRIFIAKGNFKDIGSLAVTHDGSVGESPDQNPPAGAASRNILLNSSDQKASAVMTAFSNGVQGFLLDLGISSRQVDEPGRGFSFRSQSLDMRMDRGEGLSAQDLVNSAPEEELSRIFFEYGEERKSRQIARAIVEERSRAAITSADRLTEIVSRAKWAGGRINPATLVFQALRIAVNGELENLQDALAQMPRMLAGAGRIVTISYHSLEDRIIKRAFLGAEEAGQLKVITKKVVRAEFTEIRENPRSRSAKLRCAQKA